MDIETLKALGVSVESLQDRIIDQAVDALLNANGFSEHSGEAISYESKFKREIQARLQKAVDEKIASLAAVHIVPRVGELIESADMKQTTKYGEPKGPSMTFKEYIAHRAEQYMSEDVDINGKSKNESDSSFWKSAGPRLTVLMRNYIRDTLEQHAKAAITDINKVIAANVQKAAIDAIKAASAAMSVSVKA